MPNIEDRLSAYRVVLDDAVRSLDTGEPMRLVELDLEANDGTAARRSRPRKRLALMCAGVSLIIAAIAVGLTVTIQRSPATQNSPYPAWYELIVPHLPDGYERAALLEINDRYLQVVALNLEDGTRLTILKSRVPIPPDPSGDGLPITTDQTGEWFEFDGGYNVIGTDGLQAQVACDRLSYGTYVSCDASTGTGPPQQQLRSAAASLASEITSEDLSGDLGQIAPRATPTFAIRSAIAQELPTLVEKWAITAPRLASRAFAYGVPPANDHLNDFAVAVGVLDGVTPASEARGSIDGPGEDIRWSIDSHGTMWVVSALDPAIDSVALEQALGDLRPG